MNVSKLENAILDVLRIRDNYGRGIVLALRGTEHEPVIEENVYPALNRLEKEGCIRSYFQEQASPGRGGNRRRYYSLTEEGRRIPVLQESNATAQWGTEPGLTAPA